MGSIRSRQSFFPVVIARRSAALTLTNAAFNDLAWDATDLSTGWNGTTFTVPTTGIYSIDLNLHLSITGTLTAADLYADFTVNGAASAARRFGDRFVVANPTTPWYYNPALVAVPLTAGQAIIVRIFVSFTGATAVTLAASARNCLVINQLR